VWFERGQVREGLQVVGSELPAGRQDVGVGLDPTGVGEQPSGGGVDVVAPRGEDADVPPLADGSGRWCL